MASILLEKWSDYMFASDLDLIQLAFQRGHLKYRTTGSSALLWCNSLTLHSFHNLGSLSQLSVNQFLIVDGLNCCQLKSHFLHHLAERIAFLKVGKNQANLPQPASVLKRCSGAGAASGTQRLVQIDWRCYWPIDQRIVHSNSALSKWVSLNMRVHFLLRGGKCVFWEQPLLFPL